MLWIKSIQGIFGVVIFKLSKISRLFKNNQYCFLLARYSSQLSLSQLGKAILKVGLYNQFLVSPQWQGTVFYAIGLLYARNYSAFRCYLRSLIKRKKLSSNDKKLILQALCVNYPNYARGFCKYYFPKDKLFYYSLLSIINKKIIKQNFPEELLSIKNPQAILLANNFFAQTPAHQESYLNQIMDFYHLSPVKLIDENCYFFVTNLVGAKTDLVMKKVPLISILVTTFNCQQFIEASLLSLVNQDYPNKEIIVVDDCSSDNTCKIVQDLVTKYPFIKLIQLTENVGTYVAKTVAIQFAAGEYIMCHDSDDWAHPEKLTQQIEPLLKDQNIVVTFSKWFRVTSEGKVYSRMVYPFIRLNPSSALFRRKVVEEKAGLWDLVRTGADSEFNARLKLVFGNKSICIINKPLTIGAHRENSLMTSSETGCYSDHNALIRQQYWENWNQWHIKQLELGRPIYMEHRDKKELFPIPKEICIDTDKINRCFLKFHLFGTTKGVG